MSEIIYLSSYLSLPSLSFWNDDRNLSKHRNNRRRLGRRSPLVLCHIKNGLCITYVTCKRVFIRNELEPEMKCIQIYGIEFLQTQNDRQINHFPPPPSFLFSLFYFCHSFILASLWLLCHLFGVISIIIAV